jgi:uncharacterized membrane protein
MKRLTNAGILAGVGASLGYLAGLWSIPVPHSALAVANSLDTPTRSEFFWYVAIAALAGVGVAIALEYSKAAGVDKRIRALRPLCLLWAVPLLLDATLWAQRPLFLLLVSFGMVVCVARWLDESGLLPRGEISVSPRVAWAAVIAAMTGYAAYVGFYSIRNHHLFGTAAYDLGIMENVIWNTAHGRWFASAIEGGSHLGVHTSFIYLLLAPIYALSPSPETLLVVQAVLVALAACPLWLIGKELTGNSAVGIGVALLYLLHPAIQGANFYDFHELAFAPVLFFAAFYFLLKTSRWLWLAVILLLSVKEDLSLVVILLGAYALMTSRKRTGWVLVGAGAVAYLVCQKGIIPALSVRASDFTTYYSEVTPAVEGPMGVLRTLVVNPLFAVGYALKAEKVLYLAQILAPLAFLSVLGARGLVLMAYGLAATLLASREPVYTLGFQYALLLVPQAFVAALLHAADRAPAFKRQACAVAVGMAFIVAWHHGMLFPRTSFVGGFHPIEFTESDQARARYREVTEVASRLKPDLSVAASETLVPHVARRERVQTLRYADSGPARTSDVFFVWREDLDPATRARFPEVFDGGVYDRVYEGQFTLLYARKGSRQ